ncbi:alpha/beta hydrolase [Methylonatrum kenyense]|uniref:alpha/beta hydrolase n=1 Tax=Methylonatrum kenyense TaxID=455253 RepID=UPI0020BD8F16|nr:alpha/beta hydrolase [Methylonatrum kenyense]MCK8515441.1 alpha/beta hydrolase [Methylonatrum kenyense]
MSAIRFCLLFLCCLLLSGCAGFFFFPDKEHYLDPADHGIVYEDVYFESTDGVRLHGWWLPADNEAEGTVLFLHGNAQNISTHIGAVHWLPEQGFNVFLLDYRGFGKSEGRPDFAGVHRDAEAALDLVRQRDDVNPDALIVFGQSLGASLAITLVAERGHKANVRGVIADSPFSSYRGIAREKFAGFWLTWPFQAPLARTISDQFDPIDRVHRIAPIPLLLLAGKEDEIVPPHHAQALLEAAEGPVELRRATPAGHTEALLIRGEKEYLVDWMRRSLRQAGPDG